MRSIEMEGLVWGSSKLVPVAFGVKKLQIQCVVEDDKVSKQPRRARALLLLDLSPFGERMCESPDLFFFYSILPFSTTR